MSEQSPTIRRSIQLLFVFAVSVSMVSLAGPLSAHFVLPNVQLAHATTTQVPSLQPWVPAGPETNTELVSIFTSPSTELTSGLLPASIDFGDWPLTPSDLSALGSSPNAYFTTAPLGDHFYREVEFDLANNFWGCNMAFGTASCGTLIRHAVGHLLDKNAFTTNPPCGTACLALDNPIPQPVDPNTPISCAWDATFPGNSANTNCEVGYTNGANVPVGGIVANSCVRSGATCPTGTGGHTGTCFPLSSCAFGEQAFGSPDFCAAAHEIQAAIGGTLNTDCSFATIPAGVTANPFNFYVRQDVLRNTLGINLAENMCAVLNPTGGFTEGCTAGGTGSRIVTSTNSFSAGDILTVMVGPIKTFPGFTTCLGSKGAPCAPFTGTTSGAWGMYTAGFQTGGTYDVMYFGYNGQFVSAPLGNTPNPCAGTVSTNAAGNYMYYCSQLFDAYSAGVEFAPCSSAGVGSDPVASQTTSTLTFGACGGFGFASTDFVVAAGTVVNGAPLGSSFNVPVLVTSIGGFAGTVSITATSNNAATATVTAGPVSVPVTATFPGSAANTVLVVSTTSTAGTATITVTGTVGATTHSVNITVIVGTTTLITSATATRLSPATAQYLSQDVFGKDAATIPVFSGKSQQAYLKPPTACATAGTACDTQGWARVPNSQNSSIFSFWVWLNAWNACPRVSGSPCQPGSTMVQGFSQTSTSLSPYKASTVWDFAILGNIMDSIYATRGPYDASHAMDWMTVSHCVVGAAGCSALSYTPPPGTTVSIHNTLRSDLFWHDAAGGPVTAWDVAFSYNTLIKNGAFQALGLSGIISGITVLSNTQFDINLFAAGPFTELAIGAVSIMPGHLWSSCASTWSSVLSTPINGLAFPSGNIVLPSTGGCMDGTTADTAASFDPLANGLLVGSGAFTCQSTGVAGLPPAGTIGSGCSNTNTGSPTTSFTLTRFGCTITGAAFPTCVAPASTISGMYFRSASNLALYTWTGYTGDSTGDTANASVANSCKQPTGTTFAAPAGCLRWLQGIGNPSGDGVACCILDKAAVDASGVFSRFFKVDWTSPIAFPPTSLTLAGVDTFPAVLYEGAQVLNPSTLAPKTCTTAGNTFSNGAGYDC